MKSLKLHPYRGKVYRLILQRFYIARLEQGERVALVSVRALRLWFQQQVEERVPVASEIKNSLSATWLTI